MRANSWVAAGIVAAAWSAAYGHDLQVGEVPVRHSHLCEREVQHDLTVVHRRAFTPDQTAQVTSQARAAIASIATLGTRVVMSSPPDNGKNCHGVTFDGGRSWIDDPTPLLRDCRKIDRADVQAGDVVVYKDGGRIKHSGRVTRIDESGIWVHSQWGAWGDFDHLVDAVTQGEEFEWDWKPDEKAKGKSGRYGTPEFYRCP